MSNAGRPTEMSWFRLFYNPFQCVRFRRNAIKVLNTKGDSVKSLTWGWLKTRLAVVHLAN